MQVIADITKLLHTLVFGCTFNELATVRIEGAGKPSNTDVAAPTSEGVNVVICMTTKNYELSQTTW